MASVDDRAEKEAILRRWALRLLILEAVYRDVRGRVAVASTGFAGLTGAWEAEELGSALRVLEAAGLLEKTVVTSDAVALTARGLAVIELSIQDPELRWEFGSLRSARSYPRP